MYDGKMENLTPAQQAAQDERTEDDKRNGRFIAAERTNLPLNDFMTRLMAEEIPMLDSNSRGLVYKLLIKYEVSEMITHDEFQYEIRDIMDLYEISIAPAGVLIIICVIGHCAPLVRC